MSGRDMPATLQRAPQRRRVYEFICAEHEAGRPFPTKRQIADHMGWKNKTGAGDCLNALAGLDGLLARSYVGREVRFSLPVTP